MGYTVSHSAGANNSYLLHAFFVLVYEVVKFIDVQICGMF